MKVQFEHYIHIQLALTVALSEIPSRTSFVFYAGLEGLGGLELETDENENVRNNSFCLL